MLGYRGSVVAVCSTIAAVCATACASRSGPRTDRPETPFAAGWVSPVGRDHPLAGRIWDARQRRFVGEEELRAAAGKARLLLLGEVHDNADHHLLQARLVRVVTATGRRPSIAFEMLDETQQPAIDAIPKGEPGNPSAVRDAVRWDQSGWPEFKLYRPIFEAAADAALPIVGANLPRERIRAASRSGVTSLPVSVRDRIERQGPLPEAIRAEMRAEMAESHCGELPDSMLDPLILGQRARDAQLATRLVAGATADGAILITGSGHARRDRGVPSYLAPDEAAAGGGVVAVAFQEVSAERPRVEDYPSASPEQFDFLVFTPGAAREDPCEKLREQMRKHPPVGSQDEGTRL